MVIRRGVVVAGMALALVIGGAGCGKVAEKAAEKAIEHSGECDDIDIKDGGVSGTCNDESFDADLGGDASLPADWPAELTPPTGAKIVLATETTVTAGLDGDLNAVYDEIKAGITEAGWTIDNDTVADGPTGLTGALTATGPEFTVTVTVNEDANALEGNLSLNYILTPVTG